MHTMITANNDGGAPDQVAAGHSLDDSENTSGALHNDLFFDDELDAIFDGDDDRYPAVVAAGGVDLDLDPIEPEGQLQNRLRHQEEQPDLHASSTNGVPSTITTRQSSTETTDVPKPNLKRRNSKLEGDNKGPKLKRRNSKMEGENRVLPPPGWHSEAADRHHRQEMILDM